MRTYLLVLSAVSLLGCGSQSRNRGGGGGGGDVGGGGGMPMNPAPGGPDADTDHDGYTPNTGDCNDASPLVGPQAVEMVGNNVDDDCNGSVDEATPTCDATNLAKNDPDSLVQAMEQCDKRFFLSAMMNGPSNAKARNVVDDFGNLKPQGGANMVLLSTGIAADKNMSGYVQPQSGTDFANTFANPAPTLAGSASCGTGTPAMVNDYTELTVRLKAPANAYSFSFNFHFFSAEYPEYVCTQFNDKFLVMMEAKNEFQTPENIAFDMQKNPITVNSGFFTICENDSSKPQTQNCKKPVSELTGTGYEDKESGGIPFPIPIPGGDQPIGGSTDWLTTTAPVTPGEEVILHFIIFDEGDGILDSAALIDNFRWGTQAVEAPTTIQ
jgi:hypothetical protein